MPRRSLLLAAAVAALLVPVVASAWPQPKGRVNFGLLEGQSDYSRHVATRTTRIPLQLDTPLPYFGMEVLVGGPEEHHLQVLLHQPADGPATESRVVTLQRWALVGFILHSGATPAHCRAELLLDGKPWKSVEYDLVAP